MTGDRVKIKGVLQGGHGGDRVKIKGVLQGGHGER